MYLTSLMLRLSVALCFAAPLTVLGESQDVAIFVTAAIETSKEGWVETPTREAVDSARDLRTILRFQKGIRLVKDREQAKLVLEVRRRFVEEDGVVEVVLKVGDYRLELRGVGTSWRGAARDIARQVESFVKDNRQKLLEERSPHTAAAG